MVVSETPESPLVFAAFLGDNDTLKSLLGTGVWPQACLDEALGRAALLNHVQCVKVLLEDGRACLCASDACNLAALQNNILVLSLLLQNGGSYCDLRRSLPWVAYQDNRRVLEMVAKFQPFAVYNNAVLLSAFQSQGEQCVRLLLDARWEIDARTLRTALVSERHRHHVPAMLRCGARVDAAVFALALGLEDPSLGAQVRRARARQLWRKAKAAVLINTFWRHWVLDYYSPGNDRVPRGKGFERVFADFRSRLSSSS